MSTIYKYFDENEESKIQPYFDVVPLKTSYIKCAHSHYTGIKPQGTLQLV